MSGYEILFFSDSGEMYNCLFDKLIHELYQETNGDLLVDIYKDGEKIGSVRKDNHVLLEYGEEMGQYHTIILN